MSNKIPRPSRVNIKTTNPKEYEYYYSHKYISLENINTIQNTKDGEKVNSDSESK